MTATDDKWTQQLGFDLEWAKGRLLEEGSVVTIFNVFAANTVHTVPCLWRSDRERDEGLALIKALAIVHGAEALSFLSEAWVRHQHPYVGESDEGYAKRLTAINPSQSEDRREVLICSVVYNDDDGHKRKVERMCEIIRDDDGKPIDLVAFGEGASVLSADGDLDGLLPPRGYEAPPVLMAAAKRMVDEFSESMKLDHPTKH
jgi:hypothetical protein